MLWFQVSGFRCQDELQNFYLGCESRIGLYGDPAASGTGIPLKAGPYFLSVQP